MSLKMGPLMVGCYKQEWEKVMECRYGSGNCPSSGPDCFEAWLSEQVYSLRRDLDYTKRQVEKSEQTVRKYKKQRNIAIMLCLICCFTALFFALKPVVGRTDQDEVNSSPEDTHISFSEWTIRRAEQNYIASVNSDKYHLPSCDYVDNILEENRIYYATTRDAEDAGKTPCSVCRP